MTNEFTSNRWLCIQLTRKFNGLPDNELWLEDLRNTINTQDIIIHTHVWIADNNNPVPLSSKFTIQEIVYTFNKYKAFKFFINLYYDDFGAFNKAYHKLGGIYIQIGNMSHDLRKKLRNHFLISFVPFGGEFSDVLQEFIADMKELQNGRHNAEYECRACKISQNQLSDVDFDIFQNGRYHHKLFDTIQVARNNTAKKTGLTRRLFDHLLNRELEKSRLDALHYTWRTFEMPRNWKRFQSPINYFESYWM
ncbi:15177_t:CDS:2, partial [Funneliformis geosporum]